MGNSTKPNQMPNQSNTTKTPNQNDKNLGNQKEQIRPGQKGSNDRSRNPGQK